MNQSRNNSNMQSNLGQGFGLPNSIDSMKLLIYLSGEIIPLIKYPFFITIKM